MKTTDGAKPTATERFFFDNNGYLVLESILEKDHVSQLLERLHQVIARRRKLQEQNIPHTGMTHIRGKNTRIFYILDDDSMLLELIDWPAIWPYVTGLLNALPHHHASDAIVEYGSKGRDMGWHIDGHDNGYRGLGKPIPLLQLKIGYYLTDMTETGHGNLCVVPGSHKALHDPSAEDLQQTHLFPGAMQICAPAGSAILFHNALWHSAGPWTQNDGARIMLYYAYEHPWMIASQEHWGYSKDFYNRLSSEHRKLFHGFLFHPPEHRWG
ncbi:phytanoyl-CoA dioxygenase family protein [Candidatus Poribacteria bacterium]|nr:phytanoyl-CoA dioxygenase family protein [Candidatus Poribacteria bacterium]